MNTKKKKIMIADAFEAIGGEEEVAYYLYDAIPRDKYDVYITGDKNAKYFQKRSPRNNEWQAVKVKGKFDFKGMLAFRHLVKEKDIDVVHVHGYSAGYFVRIACVGLKKPIILWTMHLSVEDMFMGKTLKGKLSKYVEDILNSHTIFTNQIVCVNNESEKGLRRRGTGKVPVCTVYNGIDTDSFFLERKEKEDGALICGFISRLSEQKGLPVLLNAINYLAKKGEDIKLIIAGDGALEGYVRNYIKEHRLENFIDFRGFQKNVLSVLKDIDVLLLPSFYECFPMIILESLCSGIPVIGSNVNGIPEIINDNVNGFLIAPGNEQDLIEKIIYYIKHKDMLLLHGKNGQKQVMNSFSKEKMISNYIKLYESLLESET